MRIYDLMTNRLTNPLGFSLGAPRLSYKVDGTKGKRQAHARVRIALDEGMQTIVYDSGERADMDSLCFMPDLAPAPRTRYWWTVEACADNGDRALSAPAFFETGKMGEPWQGAWITSEVPGNMNLHRDVSLRGAPVSARAYALGVGLYELYINGEKAGDELLAPFCNAYDQWMQVQTYDVGGLLRAGDNRISVMLGDGWYKGPFGWRGDACLYGDTQALLLEIRLTYADGTEEVLGTDERWQASESRVREATLYGGETYDATFDDTARFSVKPYHGLSGANLMDRLSPPVRVTERLSPREIFTTPAGETVLDLGQEITGYVEFVTEAPRGARLTLSYFEILQEGNYYRDNLRTAQQLYTLVTDGTRRVVRPHFTFYGFRYVKLEGFDAPKLSDFTGCVVHSDIRRTGAFHSSHEKVNRFADNVVWGQRGNFLDVPTDCPQRDERMGWTGDAQAFSGTACFQMESAAFFAKYLYDMKKEQDKRGGAVPHVVPSVGVPGHGSCAWADAATVIPWNLYLFYGDRALLAAQYENMRDWVDWIERTDREEGSGRRLWDAGFHFADWLALDTKDDSVMGGTAPHFVSAAYFYYSTSLLVKAARVLGHAEDEAKYAALADEIFAAIQHKYFTPAGHMAQTTQTAYVCALFMGLARPEHVPVLTALLEREMQDTHGKLRTGFVGTTYLCRALSQAGLTPQAYTLLLNEEYPGWLYEVNMGATTVWERWNSVLPDGRISGTSMNSLNHYAYGAVMEWAFRDVAGINPVEDAPGFRRALLRPRPDARLPRAGARYESAVGLYVSEWQIEDGRFAWHIEVPFGAAARAVFPHADAAALARAYPELGVQAEGDEVFAELSAGSYDIAYAPVRSFLFYGMHTPLSTLMADPRAKALVEQYAPLLPREIVKQKLNPNAPLADITRSFFTEVRDKDMKTLAEALKAL